MKPLDRELTDEDGHHGVNDLGCAVLPPRVGVSPAIKQHLDLKLKELREINKDERNGQTAWMKYSASVTLSCEQDMMPSCSNLKVSQQTSGLGSVAIEQACKMNPMDNQAL
jgi:hypothetical protein